MSVEKLIITQEQSAFTTYLNSVIQNLRNAEALAIWCYLSSLPPQWEVRKEQLRKHFGIGQNKLDKIFTHLKERNLLKITGIRNEKGHFTHWSIHVLSGTNFVPDIQTTENQECGDQSHENHSTGDPVPWKPCQWKTVAINNIYNKKNNNNKTNTTAAMELPECVPPDDWQDFLDHRKTIKAPMSAKAQTRALKALAKLYAAGQDVAKVIDQSIINGWKGLFPVKEGTANGSNQSNGGLTHRQACAKRAWDAVKNWDATW